jgi:hypothetical protein
MHWSWDNSGYGLDGPGSIPTSARFFSSPTLGLTLPPIEWVPAALSLGVKQQEHEADCLPASSAKFKKSPAIPLLPHVFNFTFTVNALN